MKADLLSVDKLFFHSNRVIPLLRKNYKVSPVTVSLHLTSVCNQKCFYCIANDQLPPTFMSLEKLTDVIFNLKKSNVKSVVLTGGGEPTVHPNFKKAVELIKDNGMEVALISNGVNLNDERINALVKNATWVRISLDTVDKKNYKKIRGKDHCEKVLKNINKMIRKRGQNKYPTLGTQMVINKFNKKDIEKTVVKSRELGADYLEIRPVEGGEYPFYNRNYVLKIKNLINKLEKENSDFNIIFSNKWNLIEESTVKKNNQCLCYPLISTISPEGKAYICCHKVGDEKFCYGDVSVNPYNKLFDKRESASKNIEINNCPKLCRGSVLNSKINCLKRTKEHINFF